MQDFKSKCTMQICSVKEPTLAKPMARKPLAQSVRVWSIVLVRVCHDATNIKHVRILAITQ